VLDAVLEELVVVAEHPVVAVVVTSAVSQPVWHVVWQFGGAVTVTVGVIGHLLFWHGTETVISFFTIQSG
jgi:hypothetical protein